MKKRLFVILLALAMVAGLSAIMLAADGESGAVAKIGKTEYATLEYAVAAVPTDGTETTITLLRDATGGGVIVSAGQNIIFDFDGNTYTVGEPTVGSTNTETNGFQLLRDSTVTMKNGTLKASDYVDLKIMIQNYSDLTLLDMELDAREAPQCQYVASNNFGDVLITGDTSIYAADGQVAFDVYYWPNGGYGDGVSVTVDTTGTIEGTVEYGSDNSPTGKADIAEKAPLIIKSGTIDGTISTYYLDAESNTGINITGGSFTSDVSKYVAEGNKLVDDGNGNYSISVDEETAIAEANGVGYTSLQEAIDVISGTGEVKLLSDTTEDIIISSGDITLNLNGCTLTNASGDTISVKIGATLTVTGDGTVDNKSNGKAAIFNEGTVILNGGTYDRTSETGSSADVSGGNSWYTICNHGTMTINEGVTVKNTGSFSSMIENGYYSYGSGDVRTGYVEGTNAANPSLIINNGSFIGGLNTVKNDDGGILEINGGTYTNTTQAAILNWNAATITNGTFECSAANCVLNGAYSAAPSANNQGILTITGGNFTSSGTPISNYFTTSEYIEVSGGTFSEAIPEEFCPEGNKPVLDDNGNYVIGVDESTAVAEANGKGYPSLQAAIDAISGTGEVKLLSNTAEDIIISSGNITLNLNGCTLTNVSSDTISVKIGATLTVTGDGTVDNKSNGRAAIFNEGTVILNGGTYDRTSETGSSADVSGGNSWYTICNHGTMTINEGVTVKNTGSFSSMIENGYYSYGSGDVRTGYVEGTNAANPSLIINNGSFIGGLNTVKNDDGGILEINGGTYTNTTQAAILNWNAATITNGTFECSAANCILNGASSAAPSANNQGILTITGGSFTSSGTPIVNYFTTSEYIEVSGGTFSAAIPEEYYAPGFSPVIDENGNYVVKGEVNIIFMDGDFELTGLNTICLAGEKITAPTGTIKPGYTVEGWYTDAELTDKWDFENDVVSGEETSLVLYAKFVAVDTVLNYPCSQKNSIEISSGITAPDGYTYKFSWKNAKGEIVGTEADISVAAPGAGNSTAYTLTVTSIDKENKTQTYTLIYQVTQDAHTGGKATCTHQAKCSVCNERYGELNPDNHAYATEIRNVVAATTETEGYTGDTYCKGCGAMIRKGSVIPKLDHEHSMVKTDAKAATCTEAGNIEYYTCSVCGKLYKDANGTVEITLAETVVEATGHQYGSEYKHSDTEHWKECTVCGEKTDVAEHTFGEWVITKEATATSDGSRERTCSVCGATVTEVIPATGEETTAPIETTAPAEKSDTNVGMIVLWVVIALVVIAAVVFIILYMKKKKSTTSTGSNANNKPTPKN